eukprot:CAMPEP_0174366820 /NCGR_PEP_ID=MMETSP0811_2-20130205/82704_1 /TAXON_ID=73025 ORGANISM="Eutreptiella gymnastica-like, Strain CCMP1594" /NCGR_SAMPLE_ID=MMETSP0811_2 /ASSEMBLY_ACC=CAM_ASM_000667 /LENGTH=181 /DNA_ID=CAMNT_0015508753 /DNA_START=643 /DNA_END=1188 /DNA_ORIENTATION=-
MTRAQTAGPAVSQSLRADPKSHAALLSLPSAVPNAHGSQERCPRPRVHAPPADMARIRGSSAGLKIAENPGAMHRVNRWLWGNRPPVEAPVPRSGKQQSGRDAVPRLWVALSRDPQASGSSGLWAAVQRHSLKITSKHTNKTQPQHNVFMSRGTAVLDVERTNKQKPLASGTLGPPQCGSR